MTDSPAEQAVAAFFHSQRSQRKRRRLPGDDKLLEAIKARLIREGHPAALAMQAKERDE